MKNRMLSIMTGMILMSSITVSANAFDIQNGGFENGTLGSWVSTGQTSVTNAGLDIRTNNNLSTVGVDNHSAMVGDQVAWGYAGSETSSISQSWTKTNTFDTLYFNWAAVALVPTNGGHSFSDTPWFQIKVMDGTTTLFSQEYFTGNPGSIVAGWQQGKTDSGSQYGTNSPGIWYYRPWEQFSLDLTGITNGDTLSVMLTTRDCTQSGHASYAYLDGFGSVPQPINPVPEPGTMLLLGIGMAGLAIYGKRRNQKRD